MHLSASAAVASFAALDLRAKAGAGLSVVFFGASLTWGANATDPQRTSYRALMMQHLRDTYPACPFTFHDAAIGGPGSKLAMFRTARDVLIHRPDLVFLDFTANDDLSADDLPTLSGYETVLRELAYAGAAVVQVMLPFRQQAEAPHADPPARLRDHLRLAEAYGAAAADAVGYVRRQIAGGRVTVDQLWPTDPAHPGDAGYRQFFDATRLALETAIADGRVCRVPPEPVFGHYPTRGRLTLFDRPAPAGWTIGESFRTAAFFDQQPSRWLDGVLVADAARPPTEPIRLTFTGTFLGILGEGARDALPMRVLIDGRPIPAPDGGDAWPTDTRRFGGNLLVWREIAPQLPPGDHTVEIHPVIPPGVRRGQLRLESLCVAG